MVATVGSIAINLATNVYEFERGFKSAATTVETQSARMSDALGGFANVARAAGSLITGFVGGLAAGVVPHLIGLFEQAAVAAVTYFVEWIGMARETEAELNKQRDAIGQVAAQWGEALPALKAYNEELLRQEGLQKAAEGTAAAVKAQYRGIIEELNAILSFDLADVVQTLSLAGADPANISAVAAAFDNLAEKTRSSTASGKDALEVQRLLLELFAQTGIPVLEEYAAKYGDLAKRLDVAAAKTKRLRDQEAALHVQSRMFKEKLKFLEPPSGPGASIFSRLTAANRAAAAGSNVIGVNENVIGEVDTQTQDYRDRMAARKARGIQEEEDYAAAEAVREADAAAQAAADRQERLERAAAAQRERAQRLQEHQAYLAAQANAALDKLAYLQSISTSLAGTRASTEAINAIAAGTNMSVEQIAQAQWDHNERWNRWSAQMLARQERLEYLADIARDFSTFKSTLGIAESPGSWVGKRLTFGGTGAGGTIGQAGSGSWPGNALDPLGPYLAAPNQPALDATTSTPGTANINVTTIVRPVLEGTRLSTQSSAEIKQAAAAGTNAALRAFHGR